VACRAYRSFEAGGGAQGPDGGDQAAPDGTVELGRLTGVSASRLQSRIRRGGGQHRLRPRPRHASCLPPGWSTTRVTDDRTGLGRARGQARREPPDHAVPCYFTPPNSGQSGTSTDIGAVHCLQISAGNVDPPEPLDHLLDRGSDQIVAAYVRWSSPIANGVLSWRIASPAKGSVLRSRCARTRPTAPRCVLGSQDGAERVATSARVGEVGRSGGARRVDRYPTR
jgi:hypothetical protein